MASQPKSNLRLAVVVAPYSPSGSSHVHLGAASKIEGVLIVLAQLYDQVILVNSAHPNESFRGTKNRNLSKLGSNIEEFLPPQLPKRNIGKLLQLALAPYWAVHFAKRKPELLWLYNGYAFESVFAMSLLRRHAPKLVLEIEDWHLARKRSSLKPLIDDYLLRKIINRLDVVTLVNAEVAKQYLFNKKTKKILFPGMIGDDLAQRECRAPFSNAGAISIGYFGGLTEEKGAGLMLKFAINLPSVLNCVVEVTGAGELTANFEEAALSTKSLKFYGEVDRAVMLDRMTNVDVVVNPHKLISEMGGGVFPFKILEALAAGRLVFSTELPDAGEEINEAIAIFDGTFDGLLLAVARSKQTYASKREAIQRARSYILSTYTHAGITQSFISSFS